MNWIWKKRLIEHSNLYKCHSFVDGDVFGIAIMKIRFSGSRWLNFNDLIQFIRRFCFGSDKNPFPLAIRWPVGPTGLQLESIPIIRLRSLGAWRGPGRGSKHRHSELNCLNQSQLLHSGPRIFFPKLHCPIQPNRKRNRKNPQGVWQDGAEFVQQSGGFRRLREICPKLWQEAAGSDWRERWNLQLVLCTSERGTNAAIYRKNNFQLCFFFLYLAVISNFFKKICQVWLKI